MSYQDIQLKRSKQAGWVIGKISFLINYFDDLKTDQIKLHLEEILNKDEEMDKEIERDIEDLKNLSQSI